MANEPKKPPKDRTREVEQLAASLFVEMYRAHAGLKQSGGIAKDAITAAREFYRALDEPQATPTRD